MAGFGLDLALLVRSVTEQSGVTVDSIKQSSINFYNEYHNGFFSPFKSGRNFGISLLTPIAAPLAFGTLAVILGAGSILAASVCIISLGVAGISAAMKTTDIRDDAMSSVALAGLIAVAAPILAVLVALLAVASFILPLVSLVTKSGATVVKAISGAVDVCCSAETEDNAIGLTCTGF